MGSIGDDATDRIVEFNFQTADKIISPAAPDN